MTLDMEIVLIVLLIFTLGIVVGVVISDMKYKDKMDSSELYVMSDIDMVHLVLLCIESDADRKGRNDFIADILEINSGFRDKLNYLPHNDSENINKLVTDHRRRLYNTVLKHRRVYCKITEVEHNDDSSRS